MIDDESHRVQEPRELKRLFAQAGIDLNRPTASHCQSGGRASVMAFGLELMGAKDVRNYYRGWSEWVNDQQTPIEPGQKNTGSNDEPAGKQPGARAGRLPGIDPSATARPALRRNNRFVLS